MNFDDVSIEYIWTGRESVIGSGPVGARATYKPSGEEVEALEHDNRLLNTATAIDRLEKLVQPTPQIVKFDYYLHESDHFDGLEWALGKVGVKLTEDLYEKIGRPFYEVELKCELDVNTGEVTILGVS
jgi:hypothetical protein